MGLDDPDGDGDDRDVEVGRARASRGHGHMINAGLPSDLPEWTRRLPERRTDLSHLVRKGAPRGSRWRVDWPKTIRRWSRRGYADASLVWERSPRGPSPIVVLWDVSGSMASYAAWYFPWLYRLVTAESAVHVFAFGTALADLTDRFRKPYREALQALYEETDLWGSGTAIGDTFQDWITRYGRRLLGPATTVLVISDGWDAGNPETLQDAMHRLASRTRRIEWINPLMVTEGFEPKTRALRIARQFTDNMSAGASPEELVRLNWRLGFGR